MDPAAPLTVAIPFYRGKEYLRVAIESVLAQKESGWRLLVCDDCGPEEGVGELVRSYDDSRLRYHRNETNLGMAANWNRCLDLADTDLVTLLHGDDALLPEYAGLMVRGAAAWPGATAFFCNARIIDADGRACFSFPDLFKRVLTPQVEGELLLSGRRGLEALSRGDFIMCPTVCYRKSRLGSRRFRTDLEFVQDFEFFTRLILDGDALVGLPAVAYAYRRHPANATTAYTETLLRFREEAALYDTLSRTAAARGWGRAARIARGKWIVKLHVLFRVMADLMQFRPRPAVTKLRFLASLLC